MTATRTPYPPVQTWTLERAESWAGTSRLLRAAEAHRDSMTDDDYADLLGRALSVEALT